MEEKETKKKKKSRKKKDFPLGKKETLEKVQQDPVFPDPDAISSNISPLIETGIEKAYDYMGGSARPHILERSSFIEGGADAESSHSAQHDEVETIVSTTFDNQNCQRIHDSTETVLNADILGTDKEANSVSENTCNHMSSVVTEQVNDCSNCQTSISSDAIHIEDTSKSFPTDFSRDATISHLKICLESELKSSQLLRLQISTLEELIGIRDADEARMKRQLERLRTENDSLGKEVLELKDMLTMLMQDRSKLLAKMVILQSNQKVVDKVDPPVDGSLIYQQIDDPEPDLRKEDLVLPSASCTLHVEAVSGSLTQTIIRAPAVDKLIPQIVNVMRQEKQCDTSVASGTGVAKEELDGTVVTVESGRDESAAVVPNELVLGLLDSEMVNNEAGNLTWCEGFKTEPQTSQALEIKEIERSNPSVKIESIVESEENTCTSKGAYVTLSHELLAKSSASDNYLPKVKFSDAPLIGAPFRFVSFMSRFVSGADLTAKPDR